VDSARSVADLGMSANRSKIYLAVTVSKPVATRPFI